jgi:hypothetical protein
MIVSIAAIASSVARMIGAPNMLWGTLQLEQWPRVDERSSGVTFTKICSYNESLKCVERFGGSPEINQTAKSREKQR